MKLSKETVGKQAKDSGRTWRRWLVRRMRLRAGQTPLRHPPYQLFQSQRFRSPRVVAWKYLETFKAFPPRQALGSFNISSALDKMQ